MIKIGAADVTPATLDRRDDVSEALNVVLFEAEQLTPQGHLTATGHLQQLGLEFAPDRDGPGALVTDLAFGACRPVFSGTHTKSKTHRNPFHWSEEQDQVGIRSSKFPSEWKLEEALSKERLTLPRDGLALAKAGDVMVKDFGWARRHRHSSFKGEDLGGAIFLDEKTLSLAFWLPEGEDASCSEATTKEACAQQSGVRCDKSL